MDFISFHFRSGSKRCGICNELIDETAYRSHVAQCGLEDNHEVKPVLKICGFCGRQVQDLFDHYQKCTGGDSPIDNMSENYQRPSVTQVRSVVILIIAYY